MDNKHNSNIKLSEQEKIKFRNLAEKILAQQSQPDILSDYDKRVFWNLLEKLELSPQIKEENVEKREYLNILIGILSLLSFYVLFVGIPIAVAWTLNLSSLLILYIIISATMISITSMGALIGKVSWGMAIIVSVPLISIGILLFLLLT